MARKSTGISIDPATGLPLDWQMEYLPTLKLTGERFEAMLGGDGTDEDGDGVNGKRNRMVPPTQIPIRQVIP